MNYILRAVYDDNCYLTLRTDGEYDYTNDINQAFVTDRKPQVFNPLIEPVQVHVYRNSNGEIQITEWE